MRSFTDYLDDIGWRNRVNGRNRITEGRVELPDDADTSGLFINTSNSKLNVNDRYYCIAPKDVVKLLASRKISGIREVEEDELEDIYTADEMNAFLLDKGSGLVKSPLFRENDIHPMPFLPEFPHQIGINTSFPYIRHTGKSQEYHIHKESFRQTILFTTPVYD